MNELTRVLCWRNVWRAGIFGQFWSCSPLLKKKKKSFGCSLHEAGEYTRVLFLLLQSEQKDCVKPARELWIDCPLGNTLTLHTKVLILFLHSKLLWCPTEKHRLQLLNCCFVWCMLVMSFFFFQAYKTYVKGQKKTSCRDTVLSHKESLDWDLSRSPFLTQRLNGCIVGVSERLSVQGPPAPFHFFWMKQ